MAAAGDAPQRPIFASAGRIVVLAPDASIASDCQNGSHRTNVE
jgi:hypothetical protein